MAVSFSRPLGRLLSLARQVSGPLLSSAFEEGRRGARPGAANDAREAPDDECRRSMRSVLETQVIPRLLRAQRSDGTVVRPAGAAPAVPEERIVAFACCCCASDREGASAAIAALVDEGLDQEGIFVDLIGPAARYLGRQWEADRLAFTDVTVGLVLMHEVIHAMGYEVHDGPQVAGRVQRVMLASAPGSQHVLGLSIVSEFFRKAGWQVVLEVSASGEELCHAVRNEWFDLVGLSVALDAQLPRLPELVGRLRAASINPGVPVLLGGQVFADRGLAPQAFGAQAICVDARRAVEQAAAVLKNDG